MAANSSLDEAKAELKAVQDSKAALHVSIQRGDGRAGQGKAFTPFTAPVVV